MTHFEFRDGAWFRICDTCDCEVQYTVGYGELVLLVKQGHEEYDDWRVCYCTLWQLDRTRARPELVPFEQLVAV